MTKYYKGRGVRYYPAADETARCLIISFGESNSGGRADNAELSESEALARPELPILNVNTDLFEPLLIGTNNNLDHQGLDSTEHGWECGLANLVSDDPEIDAYYVQTGQGGSTVAEWDGIGTDPFIAERDDRVNTAKSLKNFDHIAWWVSLGINDAIAGVTNPVIDADYYEANMLGIINDLKTLCPGSKVVIAELIDTGSGTPQMILQQQFNVRLQSIATNDPDVVTVSVGGLSLRDNNHWDYAGMKILASRMYTSTKSLI